MGYKLSTIGALLFVIGLGLIAWMFVRTLSKLSSKRNSVFSKTRRVTFGKVLVFCIGLIIIAAAQFCFWLTANLNAYAPVDPDQPIAVVSFEQPFESDPIMNLSIRRGDSQGLIPSKIVMQANVAVLEIEVIKFSESLEFLELSDHYRVATVRFLEKSGAPLDSLPYKSIQEDAQKLWNFFDKLGNYVPAIKTSKIISDPLYFDKNATFNIYASTSRIVMSN